MVHPIYRVQAFELVGPYTVRIAFDDHTEQVIDFRPALAGELYTPQGPRYVPPGMSGP